MIPRHDPFLATTGLAFVLIGGVWEIAGYDPSNVSIAAVGAVTVILSLIAVRL